MNKKKLPPLNWLRSFESSARHLSITKAADELNLTRAAVSKQIKCLEYNLGVSLFTRLPRGLGLSDDGAAYLPAVHEAIERISAATDELFGHGRSETLTICVNLVFFTSWLAPRLSDFHEKYPKINIRFTSAIWMMENDIEPGTNMEIRYGRGGWKNMKATRLTYDELVPVCSPTLLDTRKPLKKLADLENHTLLHVIGYEEGWGYFLNKMGCDAIDVNQGMHFDTSVSSYEMAYRGLGVALGRTSLAADAIEQGRLVAPLEERIATEEAFYLVYRDTPTETSQEGVFRRWLIEHTSGSLS